MIIGDGAIARACPDRDDLLFFASGVADSTETRESEFWREITLLNDQDRNSRIVYFSSLCVFYSKNRYARHKLQMEGAVKFEFPKHTIIRLGNVEWADNPRQLIPFIRDKIKNEQLFPVLDEYRFVLSRREFDYWMQRIPNWNCEMNIPGEMIHMSKLIERLRDEFKTDAS